MRCERGGGFVGCVCFARQGFVYALLLGFVCLAQRELQDGLCRGIARENFVLIPIYPVLGRFTRPYGYWCVSFIFGEVGFAWYLGGVPRALIT